MKRVLIFCFLWCAGCSFEDTQLKNDAQAAVAKIMKDPASIQFKDMTVVKSAKGEKLVCGFVNAKNGFGGYVGFKQFVASPKKDLVLLAGQSDSDVSESSVALLIENFCSGKDPALGV